MSEYLQRTIQTLLSGDADYGSFMNSLDPAAYSLFEDATRGLDECAEQKLLENPHWVLDSDLMLRRVMVHIQEKEFDYTVIRKDWDFLISDTSTVQDLFDKSYERLSDFTSGKLNLPNLRLYGGIKEIESLGNKISRDELWRKDNKVRPRMEDVWDIVRFRIVCNDVIDLRLCAQRIWETFFDSIVRCRNYYYRPKGEGYEDPYRAIHFEIGDAEGNIFELQILTVHREAVSALDHAFVFKGTIEYFDISHKEWFKNLSRAAIYIEYKEFLEESED